MFQAPHPMRNPDSSGGCFAIGRVLKLPVGHT